MNAPVDDQFSNALPAWRPGGCGWIWILAAISMIAVPAPGQHLHVSGVCEVQLVKADGSGKSLETWTVDLWVGAGGEYRIVGQGVSGTMQMREDVGCDGVDTFAVADGRSSILSSGPDDITGFAYAGRFPEDCPIAIQTVWLGYCSEGYFDATNTEVGLRLTTLLRWTPAESVTNLVEYWAGSKVPQRVTGWSRGRVTLPGRPGAQELSQYPGGFKAWRFSSSDLTPIGTKQVPRTLLLEGFAPKPPAVATSGEETTLTRRVIFLAERLEEKPGRFDPLPQIPVAEVKVVDRRFADVTKRRTLVAHAGTNGWPTRSSAQMKDLEKMAGLIAAANAADERKPQRRRWVLLAIVANGLAAGALVVCYRANARKKGDA